MDRILRRVAQAHQPKLLFIVDQLWWCMANRARSIKFYTAHKYDVSIMTWYEAQRLKKPSAADLIITMGYRLRPVPHVPDAKLIVFIGDGAQYPNVSDPDQIKNIAALLTCNKLLFDAWSERFERTYFTPYQVDTRFFFPPSARKARQGPLVVGFAGNPKRKGKGYTNIIAPAIERTHGAVRAKVQCLQNWIPWTRMREEFYYKLDVYAMMSEPEGGPNPVLEAMACGVPVISRMAGIVPEVIKNRYNGWICDPFAHKLSRLLLRLANVPLEVEECAAHVHEQVKEHGWENQVGRWIEVFDKVLNAS